MNQTRLWDVHLLLYCFFTAVSLHQLRQLLLTSVFTQRRGAISINIHHDF